MRIAHQPSRVITSGCRRRNICMQDVSLAANPRRLWRTLLILLGILAYSLVLIGVVWPSSIGNLLSSMALLVLGAAVNWLTLVRTPSTSRRIGGRAQTLWKRE